MAGDGGECGPEAGGIGGGPEGKTLEHRVQPDGHADDDGLELGHILRGRGHLEN